MRHGDGDSQQGQVVDGGLPEGGGVGVDMLECVLFALALTAPVSVL
jgi:hypothetical protein